MVIVCPPTESTLTAYILPQIFIVAEVSCLRRSKGSPTEYADLTEVFAENILPQISQNSQKLLLGRFSHRFHRSTQMVRVRRFSHRFHRIHRNSCWGDSPTDFTDQHRWLGCVYSPTDFTEFTEVRVHPLKLAASEFRGGLFSFVLFVLFVFVSSQASGSVNSVKSVGEPTHPTNLCQSVQSVGEYSPARVSVNSVKSVGESSHPNNLC